ncbi:MAG: anthranilate synthase component I family protein [Planctomycetota bacterium]
MPDTPTPTALLTTGGRTSPERVLAARPTSIEIAKSPADAIDLIHRVTATPARSPQSGISHPGSEFNSGWAIAISYDLGRHLEPTAAHPERPEPDRDLPLVIAARIDAADETTLPPAPCNAEAERSADNGQRRDFARRVKQILNYIRAGDVYQVNLTERFAQPFDADQRNLAAALFATARPAHGLYLEWPNAHGEFDSLISASPELFLSYDPSTRTLRTRPMKGTRPANADPQELEAAEKDRAELAMIVDLMRNDLTRVCRVPSVRVEQARAIDAHADSVLQATATIAGELRDGLTLGDAIGATFPPGSVTGAPKIRAMQIIDELEAAPRGLYCGLAGWIADDGRAELSVTIRAAVITGPPHDRTLDFHAGAGIVADSDPEGEWHETLLKTEVIRRALSVEDVNKHSGQPT